MTSSAGAQTGVVVDSGATVRLNGVIVEGNLSGGFAAIPGAGFDIVNSVFALNGIGMVGQFELRRRVPRSCRRRPSGPFPRQHHRQQQVHRRRLRRPLVRRLDGVLLFGNMVQEFLVCTLAANSKSGEDPRFSRPYHLGMDSPCRDAVTATDFPKEDLDGEPRPSGARNDCGADEFQATQP